MSKIINETSLSYFDIRRLTETDTAASSFIVRCAEMFTTYCHRASLDPNRVQFLVLEIDETDNVEVQLVVPNCMVIQVTDAITAQEIYEKSNLVTPSIFNISYSLEVTINHSELNAQPQEVQGQIFYNALVMSDYVRILDRLLHDYGYSLQSGGGATTMVPAPNKLTVEADDGLHLTIRTKSTTHGTGLF